MKATVSASVGGGPQRTLVRSGGVTYVFQPQRHGSSNAMNQSNYSQQQLHQVVNGGGNSVTFRRFNNNNVVQVRRVITEQPQQFHQLVNMSSSESSGCEPTGLQISEVAGGGRRATVVKESRGGGGENELELAETQSFGDVDVSVVTGGDDDDDEDLLIDQEELEVGEGDIEDGEDGDIGPSSVMEMNGMDNQYLRHVIETQILNRHKTRIKDWDGTKGHMCQSCHETFLSVNGLETHRNRRILHILFYCRNCKRDLSFFNKCRLLQHLRNHRVTPTVAGLQNYTMIRLLPESEYLHFEYEDCTSSSEEDDGGGSGVSPAKRLKPNKFRKVRASGGTENSNSNDKESPQNSPTPKPKQTTTAPLLASSVVTTAVSTPPKNVVSANSTVTGNTKIVPTGAGGGEQQRSEPFTVIKSTGNISTTSIVLSSPVAVGATATTVSENKVKPSCASPVESSDGSQPQIRIRNLSQITVSVNDRESQEDEDDEPDEMEIQPVVTKTTTLLRPQIVKVPAPTSTADFESSAAAACQPATPKEYKCFKCDEPFESRQDFFRHLQEAEQAGLSSKSLHRCPTDDIPSWSQCQYVFHTKVFHEKSVPFMCPGCGDERPDYNSLLEHVTNDCFYLSQRSRYMCAASLQQKCGFSDKKSVKTEPEIIDHLKKEHSRAVLQCLHCTQGFATDNWLLKHLAEAHNITCDESKGTVEREVLINKATRPLTQCLICNILFPNGPTYLQHVYLNFHMHILYARILECQACFQLFDTNEELATHRKQNDKCKKLDPFLMKICDSERGTPGTGGQLALTPTPIKIIANPAAIVTTVPGKAAQQQQQPKLQQPKIVQHHQTTSAGPASRAMVTVISNTNGLGSSTSSSTGAQPQQQPQRQRPLQQQHHHLQKQVTTITTLPQNKQSKNSSQITAGKSAHPNAKKNFFDDLLSCQFCERLVVFTSLRKHEDQCSGLSTVAPGFCLTCRQNFGDKNSLARHGAVHLREGLPICLFCNNRQIRPTHPSSNKPTQQETMYALSKHLYSNHTSRVVVFPYQCPLCDKLCRDKRAAEFHIKEHQFRNPKLEPNSDPDPVPLPTTLEDVHKLVKVRKKVQDLRKRYGKTIEVYYCPVCKNREFALEIGLARHLTLVHQKDPNTLNLTLLKKASTARRYLIKAQNIMVQQQRGGGDTKTTARTPSTGHQTVSSSANHNNQATASPSSPATRLASSVVLRKRIATAVVRKPIVPQRQMPVTRQRSSTESTSRDVTTTSSTAPVTRATKAAASIKPPEVRKKNGTFSCLKCPTFSCATENDFFEHIKWKHVWPESEIEKLQYGNKAGLEEPSEYWCPECNILLVAKSSLVRHLKFAHDYITNVDEYMQKIGYDGKKPLKPNQCEVCYYQCADDREVQQHIRTHGMAFLRLRQQRQSSTSNKSN